MKHSLVRETIIETASDLFYQKGYNLTGINEIIKEAGIAKATLYSHFKSKEEICLAYLNHKNNTFVVSIDEFVSKHNGGRAQLLALFDFLVEFYNDKQFNGCWCLNTISELPKHDENIRSAIQRQKMDFLELIKRIITFGYGDMDDSQKESLTRRIYLLYESAISESYVHRERWPITEAKKICEILV